MLNLWWFHVGLRLNPRQIYVNFMGVPTLTTAKLCQILGKSMVNPSWSDVNFMSVEKIISLAQYAIIHEQVFESKSKKKKTDSKNYY
jgi:hypothetical protein